MSMQRQDTRSIDRPGMLLFLLSYISSNVIGGNKCSMYLMPTTCLREVETGAIKGFQTSHQGLSAFADWSYTFFGWGRYPTGTEVKCDNKWKHSVALAWLLPPTGTDFFIFFCITPTAYKYMRICYKPKNKNQRWQLFKKFGWLTRETQFPKAPI